VCLAGGGKGVCGAAGLLEVLARRPLPYTRTGACFSRRRERDSALSLDGESCWFRKANFTSHGHGSVFCALLVSFPVENQYILIAVLVPFLSCSHASESETGRDGSKLADMHLIVVVKIFHTTTNIPLTSWLRKGQNKS
jgi:hypothetical protein